MILFRIDNLKEKRGIWRTWEGEWRPVFDDIIPNGKNRNLPMEDNIIYHGGWFAACESLEMLSEWVPFDDMDALDKAGFCITKWSVNECYTKKLNQKETIFKRRCAKLLEKLPALCLKSAKL